MLWNHQEAYAPNSESSCPSFGDANSLSSFYSQTTCDGSEIRTPPRSSRRASVDSAKFEDMSFPNVHTPERHGTSDSISSMSSMHDLGPGFIGHNMMFHDGQMMPDQGMLPLNYTAVDNFGSFQSSHGLPICTPSLDMDLSSPVSCIESYPVTMSFVDPSQTTFINTFDVNSPMKPIHFPSPTSDCTADIPFDLTPAANLNFHLLYDDCQSASTTPSRSSTGSYRNATVRQPICLPVRSSAALQQVQSQPFHTERRARKQLARKFNVISMHNNTPIHRKADHFCTWPDCDRKFKRSEHLKRHERIHRNKDSFECEFCDKRPFNRQDNLKAHLLRHMDPTEKKRTKYHPDARDAWEAMEKKKKIKTDRVVKREVPRHSTKSRGSNVTGY